MGAVRLALKIIGRASFSTIEKVHLIGSIKMKSDEERGVINFLLLCVPEQSKAFQRKKTITKIWKGRM